MENVKPFDATKAKKPTPSAQTQAQAVPQGATPSATAPHSKERTEQYSVQRDSRSDSERDEQREASRTNRDATKDMGKTNQYHGAPRADNDGKQTGSGNPLKGSDVEYEKRMDQKRKAS